MKKVSTLGWSLMGGSALVIAALVAAILVLVGVHKTVQLNVDGQRSTVQTSGNTVADALTAAHVELGDSDIVSPQKDAVLGSNDTITVKKNKHLEVTLDGAKTQVRTTGQTVEDVVTQLGVASTSSLSATPATNIVDLKSPLSIVTPKKAVLTVDGKQSVSETTALTVQDFIKDSGVKLGADDQLSVPANTPIVDGMGVKVSRVQIKNDEKSVEAIPFDTKTTEDASKFKDEKDVTTAGVSGERATTFKVVVIDGKEVSRIKLSDTVTKKPVAEQVVVGTKDRPAPEQTLEAAGAPAPVAAGAGASGPVPSMDGMWAKIMQCESGGNPTASNGTHFGLFQFDVPTWLSVGGGQYAPRADMASPAQQFEMAQKLQSQRGWSPWTCASM